MDLREAARHGNFERVQSLVGNGVDLNEVTDPLFNTHIHWASENGHLQIVDFLVKQGANLNVRDVNGRSPLYRATDGCTCAIANPRNHFPVVKYLVEHGADIHANDDRGNSSLHLACIRGNIHLVKCLVNHGADITARTVEGDTPLHQACFTAISRLPVELINTVPVGQTDYLDDNNGEGLAPGAQYCYRLVAEFAQPTGGESIASEESCSIMLADAPVVTNVDVQSTSETEGRVLVRWMEPFEIDQAMFPPPYRYDVFRSEGFSGNANRVLVSERLTDTVFVDTGLNTLTDVYNYRILLYDVNDQLVDSSAVASTVRLEPTPLVEAIELTWSAEVPWTNNSQDFPAHFVFRSVGSDDPANFVQIGAVDVNTNGFVFLDDGTSTGEPLDDETTYCYFVTTQGSYGNPAIPTPLLNNSQIGCTQPNDEVPPCTPVGFTIDEAFGCEQFLVNQSCQFSDYQNRLIWENDDNEVCEDDIRTYNIYFSETGEEPFELIANVTDREFVHTGIASYKGCYRISAVDRSGNESGLSEILCNDNCPFYELPNVFTPNGDGSNDTFVPYADSQGLNFDRSLCPRFVESVDFRLYDRLGNELYTYSSGGPENTIFIEWEGQNSSGSQLPSGVYYYVADVKFDVLDSANAEQELRGWVHLLR